MTMRRLSPTKIRLLDNGVAGDANATTRRAVTVTCSTETLGRDDIVLVSGGIDLTNYRTNPIVLWQHDPAMPVGRAVEIGVSGTDLVATVEFAPEGVSQHADTVYGLIKAGIVNAASTGFETREAEPIDPTNPRTGGIKILSAELQEFSSYQFHRARMHSLLHAQCKKCGPVWPNQKPLTHAPRR
jgi:HK97 family phage prohead protease